MSSVCFTILKDENNDVTYRLKVEWFSESFHILIVVEKNAFEGTMTKENIENQCELLDISPEQFFAECKLSLRSDLSETQFSYCMSDDNFYIKKRLQTINQKSMKVRFGCIKLQQTDFYESVTKIFDAAVKQNKKLSDEIKELKIQKENACNDFVGATIRLNEANEMKQRIEQSLYCRFLKLLNSKKELICSLNKKLEEKGIIESANTVTEWNENMLNDSIFDEDTDIDEDEIKNESPEKQTHEDPKIENISTVKSSITIEKSSSVLNDKKDDISETRTSKIESIMNSMSFLDPTVPFST